MTVLFACLAAFIAAVIQRITGLGFVLVLLGPIVLLYGPLEGVTIGVLLALVASMTAVPLVWRDVEWRRAWWLIWPGLLAAPFGAMLVAALPEAALLILIAAMAYFALVAGWIPLLAASLRGKTGAIVAGSAAGFMHVASGLSGPPLAAYAVGDKWEQRRFAASVQVIFVVLSAVSVALRGLPASPAGDVWLLVAATALGIAIGTLLSRFVPARIARIGMLSIAWAGATVVLVRGIVTLFA
ncbi:sulfite exporter TauE/SafE family protein [Microbacterium sp. C7(2022)]|uniref:sulfite exporter TauE/SafE family protein n=1 Tax=Microbacterium sp. C7(2022) TaxID=2992759 RepID=UPI00237A9BE6|nr:sulfite exporter TauE/SafE family protein [Microbacterium sp. C7(2022)]MDE0547354.1 sulfite exporter TauE/SafE family protein [Microbacterium sp. C7(2022)]